MSKEADPQPGIPATTTDPTPTATPPPVTPEQAREILIKSGFQVLTKEQLEDRIRRAEKPAAAVRTELETARADAAAAQARLREIENAGKSASDLAEERRAEAIRRLEAAQAELKTERDRTAAAEQARLGTLLDLRLGTLLAGAVDPEDALILAKTRVKGLSMSPDGTLIHTDGAGIERRGAEAEAVVKAWWAEKKSQHAAPPAGPATRGVTAPAPPPAQPKLQSVDHLDRIAEARRLNAERAAARG
jgi:hypothetical protein